MKPDPASLDNLRDIAEPPPVPWWPLAAGWWMVLAMLAVVVVAAVLRLRRNWNDNAYRRSALSELQLSTTIAEIAEILKRTALVAYPRTDTAQLSGSQWCQWLEETGGAPVPATVAEALTKGVYAKLDSANVDEVGTFANHWILNHHSQTDVREGSDEP